MGLRSLGLPCASCDAGADSTVTTAVGGTNGARFDARSALRWSTDIIDRCGFSPGIA
jgi:hypothetical protein